MAEFNDQGSFFDGLQEIPMFFKIFGGTIFLIVIGGFLYVIIKGLTTWTKNNASEMVTRPCRVVGKRTEVWGGSGDSSANTSYFITFEFDDRSRIELPIRNRDYGLIAEGDLGQLTYQGTRFKGFARM